MPPAWPFTRATGRDYRSKHRSRHKRIEAFVQSEYVITTGRGQDHHMRLAPFQKRLLRETFGPGSRMLTIWSLPRGAGKTGLISAIALEELYLRRNAEVIIASTGIRTAKLAYNRAVRAIEENPRLGDQALIFRGGSDPYVELPANGSTMRALPAEGRYLVGLSPTLLLIDEAAFVDPETWAILQSSLGKQDGAQLVAVTTPGLGPVERDGQPNVIYQLRAQQLGPDPVPTVRYLEHSAPPDADESRPATWRLANPGLGRFVSEDAVLNDWLTLPRHMFRMFRLGKWDTAEGTWISPAEWDALEHELGLPEPGARITLGFDGSSSGDHTAAVIYDPDRGRVHVLGAWGPPSGDRGTWRVPRAEVMDTLELAFDRWRIVGAYFDPWLWRSEIQLLQERHGADVVQELDTSAPRLMGPAADAFLAAVQNGRMSSDGSEQLRSHVLSAVAERTPAGDVLRKNARKPAKIDLAIAAVLAHEAFRRIDRPPRPSFW